MALAIGSQTIALPTYGTNEMSEHKLSGQTRALKFQRNF